MLGSCFLLNWPECLEGKSTRLHVSLEAASTPTNLVGFPTNPLDLMLM